MSHVRAALALTAGLVAACSPADRPPTPPEVVVADAAADADAAAAKPPLAVDILWVIDNSPGGVFGQQQLASNAKAFLDRLGGDVDIRAAVVTIQQVADVGPDGMVQKVGQFTMRIAAAYPPTGPCLPCKAADRISVNGSLTCRPECFDGVHLREACQRSAVLQDSEIGDLDCFLQVGASHTQQSKFAGAFRSAWLALDPNGPNCPKDVNGLPTADCQHARLVRKDALLVLVFTSDSDDCSVALDVPLDYGNDKERKAVKGMLPLEVWERCQSFGDAIGGDLHLNEGNCMYRRAKDPKITCPIDCRDLSAGSAERAACDAKAAVSMATSVKTDFRFAPVADYVSRFTGLKADSAQVLVAVIVGDSTAPALDTDHSQKDQRHLDRVAHEAAMLKQVASGPAPQVCSTPNIVAGFGSRYVELAEAFGKGGFQANLCTPGGLGQVMLDLADHVRARAEAVQAR